MARIEQSIEVNVPVRTAYDQLTQFEQYPRFVQNVEQVRQLDDTHVQLHARSGTQDMEWDAEITQQVPDRCIAWRNIRGPKYEGRIDLRPTGENATRVTLTMECEPKQQVLAQHGNAETAIAEHTEHDLARFKKFIERLGREAGDLNPRMTDAPAARRSGAAVQSPDKPGGQIAGQASSWAQQTAPDIFRFWDQQFSAMRKMTEDMEQFFERFIGRSLGTARARPGLPNGGWSPPIEIAQRERQFVVCAELAGVRREDVQVEVRNDRLTIEGERRQEPPREPRENRSSERAYGRFYREIALPPGADAEAASASLHDGLLEVMVPVGGDAKKGRRLEIREGR